MKLTTLLKRTNKRIVMNVWGDGIRDFSCEARMLKREFENRTLDIENFRVKRVDVNCSRGFDVEVAERKKDMLK